MHHLNRCGVLAALFAATAWGAAALAADPPKEGAAQPPQTVPEDTGPGKSGSSTGPLSDKLDRTDGIIHPPPGRDAMTRQPPPTGPNSTPVIPPPGTAGGDPKIEPK